MIKFQYSKGTDVNTKFEGVINMKTTTLSIIWNITNKCPWDCAFCVMDASFNCERAELALEQKLAVIKNIDIKNCKIDTSGGEVLFNKEENIKVLTALSEKFGKENVGVSTSGFGMDDKLANDLSLIVSDVEMTMDAIPGRIYEYRPIGYHKTAGRAAVVLKENGVYVGLQTVLTRVHYEQRDILAQLYLWMKENQVDEWSLIKYFPSGRGERFEELALSEEENRELVDYIERLCVNETGPKLDVHYLLPGSTKDDQCRCVKKSIGILPDGSVTSCFWGLDENGSIKDSKFYLGNLLEEKLSEILSGENAQYWLQYCGKCPL